VASPLPVCLTLELDRNADTVSGWIRDERGDGERFSGWMALTRGIELALAAADSRSDNHEGPGPKPDCRPPLSGIRGGSMNSQEVDDGT
jgi:hypothetical protein